MKGIFLAVKSRFSKILYSEPQVNYASIKKRQKCVVEAVRKQKVSQAFVVFFLLFII